MRSIKGEFFNNSASPGAKSGLFRAFAPLGPCDDLVRQGSGRPRSTAQEGVPLKVRTTRAPGIAAPEHRAVRGRYSGVTLAPGMSGRMTFEPIQVSNDQVALVTNQPAAAPVALTRVPCAPAEEGAEQGGRDNPRSSDAHRIAGVSAARMTDHRANRS